MGKNLSTFRILSQIPAWRFNLYSPSHAKAIYSRAFCHIQGNFLPLISFWYAPGFGTCAPRPGTDRKPSAGSGAARLQAFHLSTLSGMIFRVHNIWCVVPQEKTFHFHSGSLGAARAFPDPKCVPAAKKWKVFSGRSIYVPFFLPLSTNVTHWVFPPGLPVLLYTPSLCRKTGRMVRNHLSFPGWS